MAAIEKDAVAKPKRNTGDWRGLPTVLMWIAVVGFVGSVISVIAVLADASSSRPVGADWLIAACVFGAALFTYCIAAIIAALRGLLNR